MKKLALLAAICGGALCAGQGAASAVPLTQSGAATDTGLLVQVHGCHADWQVDRFGPHRHGRRCERIEGGRGPRVYIEPPRRHCHYVGPVRICD